MPRRTLGKWWILGLVLAVVWLTHTTAIDRLDLTKLAVALVVLSLAWWARGIAGSKGGGSAGSTPCPAGIATPGCQDGGPTLLGFVGLCLLAASVLFPRFVSARVEGWAPWLAAIVMLELARRSRSSDPGNPETRRGLTADGSSVSAPSLSGRMSAYPDIILCFTACLLVIVGIVQALGVPLFTAGVSAFADRPVMGTLGNPDLYGVCLAGSLPLVIRHSRRRLFFLASAAILVAVVLSGSRSAWLMLLPSVVVAIRTLRPARSLLLVAVSLALVLAIDGLSPRVGLRGRMEDLSDDRGTAAGRLYLWHINLEILGEAGLWGGGPEAFRRVWPEAQAIYLAEHPEDVHFYSDLRHAHVDAVEIAADWGWLGLAGMVLFAFWLIWPESWRPWPMPRRRRGGASTAGVARKEKMPAVVEVESQGAELAYATPEIERSGAEVAHAEARAVLAGGAGGQDHGNSPRYAERACLVALFLGGLATPVLFEIPSLLLAAMVAGRLVQKRKSLSQRRLVCASAGTRGVSHDGTGDMSSASRVGVIAAASPSATAPPSSGVPAVAAKPRNDRIPALLGPRLNSILASVGLLLAMFWVGQRTTSEVLRTSGLKHEVAGQLQSARELYLQAAELDPTNPLAQVMAARGLVEIDPQQALEAAHRAARELPTAAVVSLVALAESACGNEAQAREAWRRADFLKPREPFGERH